MEPYLVSLGLYPCRTEFELTVGSVTRQAILSSAREIMCPDGSTFR